RPSWPIAAAANIGPVTFGAATGPRATGPRATGAGARGESAGGGEGSGGGGGGEHDDDGVEHNDDGVAYPNSAAATYARLREGHRRRFFLGQWLDCKDTVGYWLEATVVGINEAGTRLLISYNGWPSRWDEWIPHDDRRLAPFRTRTMHAALAAQVSPRPAAVVPWVAPTGSDDPRHLLPEVARVLRSITPLVDALAQGFQPPPAPSEENDGGGSSSSGGGGGGGGHGPPRAPQAWEMDLARDVAPLFDRLGRTLTDMAPHMADMVERERQSSIFSFGLG
ncbi:unnamed protein product, partial [Phaeothamnion confervicola]